MSSRHAAVAEVVREMGSTAREGALLAVGATSRRLAEQLGVTETTALRYLRETIAAGQLVEIGHVGRKLLLPWPEDTKNPPDVWVTGEVKRGSFRVTEHREVGPAMAKIRFVFTPERLKQLMDQAVAEEAAKATKKKSEDDEQRAEHEAEEAAEQAVFAQHYPVLASLLLRLHEQVPPEASARGVRFYANKRSEGYVRGLVSIEVGDKHFEALEEILRNGLEDKTEVKLEGDQG